MPAEKICERCLSTFECFAEDIERCACREVIFSAAQKERIALTYGDCLCTKCLSEIIIEY